jgi:hypothetical protein
LSKKKNKEKPEERGAAEAASESGAAEAASESGADEAASEGAAKDAAAEVKPPFEGPEPPGPRTLLQRLRIPTLIFIITLAGYLGASGTRVKKHSTDNHYVYLANNLLHGRLSLEGSPPHQNDWALVTELVLHDGRKVRGTFLKTGGTGWFKTTRGKRMLLTNDKIRSRRYVYFVSFPWFPAVLMLPFVAIFGMKFNDVIFTACIGALNPVLVFFVLRRLTALKLSRRKLSEDLWLVACFAFGTVHFYSSVLGQVWYTAHIVGVMLTCLYVLAALEGRHPILAGLCLGLGFVTRTPIPFIFPLALGEILRRNLKPAGADAMNPGGDACHRPPLIPWIRSYLPRIGWSPTIRQLTLFALPMLAIAAAACIVNYLRFDSPLEFGHYYLNVRWSERIQRWGLFNFHFLARNAAVMLTLLPRIMTRSPYVKVSWHGLGIFFTTPLFGYLIWPRKRSPIQPWLYLSILLPMILHLFYQNSGWVQFGYRFSLDYMILLFCLLAVGGRKLGIFAKLLIIFGVVVNTFGAITFGRYWKFYWDGMFPVQ